MKKRKTFRYPGRALLLLGVLVLALMLLVVTTEATAGDAIVTGTKTLPDGRVFFGSAVAISDPTRINLPPGLPFPQNQFLGICFEFVGTDGSIVGVTGFGQQLTLLITADSVTFDGDAKVEELILGTDTYQLLTEITYNVSYTVDPLNQQVHLTLWLSDRGIIFDDTLEEVWVDLRP